MSAYIFWGSVALIALFLLVGFLLFFASDFKIERNIPIRKEWLKAWFQESMIAGFQYFKKEWKLENKIEIKQSFNISRLQYGKNEWKQ